MKSRKISLFLVALAAVLILVVSVNPMQAKAAYDDKYIYETVDRSKTYKSGNNSIEVKVEYKRVVLEGDTKAIKTINNTLKKKSDKFFATKSDVYKAAENQVKEWGYYGYSDNYEDSYSQYIQFIDNKYVSISESHYYYAGDYYTLEFNGYVFDLKTGKQIKDIRKFTTSKKLKTIQKQINNAIKEDYGPYSGDVNDLGIKDFVFYITDSYVVVCLDSSHSSGWGNEDCTIFIPRKK